MKTRHWGAERRPFRRRLSDRAGVNHVGTLVNGSQQSRQYLPEHVQVTMRALGRRTKPRWRSPRLRSSNRASAP